MVVYTNHRYENQLQPNAIMLLAVNQYNNDGLTKNKAA